MTNLQPFDIFLCHNSKDKTQVEQIKAHLAAYRISTWLDKTEFEPFADWKDQLDKVLAQTKAAAIFLGPYGLGKVQQEEIKVLSSRNIRIGLVILPACTNESVTLVQDQLRNTCENLIDNHWVDFRQKKPDPIEQLIWGITGNKPIDNLASEIGGPTLYARLRDLLDEGRWKEADQETNNCLCRIWGIPFHVEGLRSEAHKFLGVEFRDIRDLPDADLTNIDRLWIKYSCRSFNQPKFGFSIQKKIWQDCRTHITCDSNRNVNELPRVRDYDIYEFSRRLNWSGDTSQDELLYAMPDGCLPSFIWQLMQAGFGNLHYHEDVEEFADPEHPLWTEEEPNQESWTFSGGIRQIWNKLGKKQKTKSFDENQVNNIWCDTFFSHIKTDDAITAQ